MPFSSCTSPRGLLRYQWDDEVFLFVLVATVLEATGDAIVRIALDEPSIVTRVVLS